MKPLLLIAIMALCPLLVHSQARTAERIVSVPFSQLKPSQPDGSTRIVINGTAGTPCTVGSIQVLAVKLNGVWTCTDLTASGGSGGAPINATFITQTPNSTLTAEQALSILASGILKGNTGTGVVTIAVPGTDYLAPAGNGSQLTALNASVLASGTLPDARFPSTLPILSGANLIALNAGNLSSGIVPDARFPITLPALSGANLTSLNASNLSSGTLPDARFPATLPAANGSNLTSLNASNLASGTVPPARLGTGSGGAVKFLREDSTWQTVGGSGDTVTVNGSAATDANFINTVASGIVPSITWSLNTGATPDEVSISAIGAASATEAGILTTGTQTVAGVKSFTGQINAANLLATSVTVDSTFNSCVDAGSTDAYACSLSPGGFVSFVTGQLFWFKANTANTGAATVNFQAIGARTIKKMLGGITTDLADNDIRAGQWVQVQYDGTNWQMQSQLGNATGGITSLEGQTGVTQTFTDDANVTIVSGSNAHVITWSGTLAASRGGTGNGAPAEDQLIVGNGTGFDLKTLPSCSDATTSKLLYNSSTNAFSCGADQTAEGGSGITTLNTLTGAVQTFSKTDDTNVTLTLTPSGTDHNFALGWTGTLADARVADNITLTNITQITNRAIGDITGDLAASRVDDGGAAATQALFSGAGSAAGFRAIADADIPDTITLTSFSQIGGSVTDAQVPNTITIDLATLATTADTANAGDSATAFFSSGTVEAARLPDAVADGATKGIASFTAADFNASSGNISIDYTNGTAASGSVKGFLTAADWTTFNNKVPTGAVTSSGLTMATARLLGRSTASTGAIEEITVGTGLSLSGGTLTATGGGSGDMVLASSQTVTGRKLFDPAKLVIGNVATPPTPELGALYVDTDDGSLYFGIDGSTWGEFFIAGVTTINVSSDITGDLPFANFVPATAASKLVGRGSASGAGDFEEITIGSGLTMTGTTLSSSGAATIVNGTSALGTSAISSGACATVVTTTATGTATTDTISWGFNSDPTGVTGYAPVTTGALTIFAYPSTNNVNFKACNLTNASITPGAITLNWRILR